MAPRARAAALIPAYNAGRFIGGVIERILKNDVIDKVIVVDDGSVDDTAAVVGRFPRAVLVRHPRNRGYGGAQKSLYAKALELGYDATVILHADGQHDPAEIPLLLAPVLSGEADVVVGARMDMARGGMPWYKIAGNVALTWLENMAFGMKLTTFHSGYRACNRKAVERLDFSKLTEDYHFDSHFLLYSFRGGSVIREVPVKTIYGEEKSGVNVVTYGFNILGLVASQLWYRLTHPGKTRTPEK
jgi:glycosyltransferase involved in cell wall biosynthesis